MSKGNDNGLGNKPIIVIIGLIASCIAIFAFVTGRQSIPEIINTPIFPTDNNQSISTSVFTPPTQQPSPIDVVNPTPYDTPQPTNTPLPQFKGKIAYFGAYWLYPSDRENNAIFITDANNNATTIDLDALWSDTRSYNVTWAPDGSQLAFGLGMDLFAVNSSGGTPKKIFTLRTSRVDDEDSFNTRGFIGSIAWSPSNNLIAISVVGQCQGVSGKIILLNTDGSNPNVVLENDVRYAGLGFSPDGSKLFYSAGQSQFSTIPCGTSYAKVGIIDIASTSINVIAEFPGWEQNSYGGGSYIDHSSWSPDGSIILFDLIPHHGMYDTGDYDNGLIYKISPDGSQIEQFIKGYSPSWSPDGQQFVYHGIGFATDCNYRAPIIIANANGSNTGSIGCGFDPTWSP